MVPHDPEHPNVPPGMPVWEPPPPVRTRRVSRPPTQYGDPVRALIDPALCGGFVLLTEFTRAGWRRTGVDLGTRWDTYSAPLPAEIATADAGLSRLGLTRIGPWEPGSEEGSLTAPVVRAPRPGGWFSRCVSALCRITPAGTAFPQHSPLVGPGTTGGTEDRA
jgi:hypothetical protein